MNIHLQSDNLQYYKFTLKKRIILTKNSVNF